MRRDVNLIEPETMRAMTVSLRKMCTSVKVFRNISPDSLTDVWGGGGG